MILGGFIMKLNLNPSAFAKMSTALDKLNEATAEAVVTGNLNLNKISESVSMVAEVSGEKVPEFHITPAISVDPSLLEDEDWKNNRVDTDATYEILNKFKKELMEKMFDKEITIDEYTYLNLLILPVSIYVNNGSEVSAKTIKKFFSDLKLADEISKVKSTKYLNMVKAKMGQKYHDDFVNIVIPAAENLIP